MPGEQLQLTEVCYFPNLCKKKPFNFTDLAVGPGVKKLIENPALQLHMKTAASS